MVKPKIGIVSQIVKPEEGRVLIERTSFSPVLYNKLKEFDVNPYGLLLDEKLEEDYFNEFDGFVFQGGNAVNIDQIMAMHYAIRSGKPILGICMGMQTMAAYEYVYRHLNGDVTLDKLKALLEFANESKYLMPVLNHNNCNPFYIDDVDKSKHTVYFNPGSYIESLCGQSSNMPSLHNNAVRPEVIDYLFQVKGTTDDGVIEVIEGNGISAMGVQFHPEIVPEGDPIFNGFAEQVLTRKKY